MINELHINGRKSRGKTRGENGKDIKGGKNFKRENGQNHYKLQGS